MPKNLVSNRCIAELIKGEALYHDLARRMGFTTLGGAAEKMRQAFLKLGDTEPLHSRVEALQKARGKSFVLGVIREAAAQVSLKKYREVTSSEKVPRAKRFAKGSDSRLVWITSAKHNGEEGSLGFTFSSEEEVDWFLTQLELKIKEAFWQTYETRDGMRALAYELEKVDPDLNRVAVAHALPQYLLDVGRAENLGAIEWNQVLHLPIFFQEGSTPQSLGLVGLVYQEARSTESPETLVRRLVSYHRNPRAAIPSGEVQNIQIHYLNSFGSGFIFTAEIK